MNLARFLPKYTIEDYLNWEGDWELIDGLPFAMSPSPFTFHQAIILEIARQFLNQIDNCKNKCYVYAELDWIINEHTIVRPDIAVTCFKVKDYIKFPPEIVIEIVSKSTALKDEELKFKIYQREGVKYYVLVYPNVKKVRVFKLIDGKYHKVFENDKESFTFDLSTGCNISLNVEDIWKVI